jgi:chromosome partitioning protein
MIPRNVRLSEAPSFGMPIIQYDVSSKGAECYSELAHLVSSGKVKKQSKIKGGKK